MSLSDLSVEELERMLAADTRNLPPAGATEHRSIAVDDFEFRATGKNLISFTGYASIFDYGYQIGDGWTEIVDKRAFDQTLKQEPDVQLLVNHDSVPLARTGRTGISKPPTLFLNTDTKGLHVEAELDTTSPLVQTVRSALERGDMDEMSFAFRAVADDRDQETRVRRLLEVDIDKGDVSIVNYGASGATSAQLRFAEQLERFASLDPSKVLVEMRSFSNPTAALEKAQRNIGALLRTVGGERLSVSAAEAICTDPRDNTPH